MFEINNDKLIDKLMNDIIPEIEHIEVEDIVKYNLALKYLMELSSLKEFACFCGATAGTVVAILCSSPYIIAAGITGVIASGIGIKKSNTAIKKYKNLFMVLSIALDMFHNQTTDSVKTILNSISAEDLVNFLEKENLTSKEEA